MSGCRFGYEVFDLDDGLGGAAPAGGGDSGLGDGGESWGGEGGDPSFGGSSSGGATSGGSSSGGAGAGGAPSSLSVLTVSTDVDEEDAGATFDDPLGSGLSLREAILIANAEPGHQSISFETNYSIVLIGSALPTIFETMDLVGPVSVDASNLVDTACLTIESQDVRISSVTIDNCPSEPILVGGDSNEVTDCTVQDSGNSLAVNGQSHRILRNRVLGSAGAGIWCNAPDSLIFDNHVEDALGVGVQMAGGAISTQVMGNVILRGGVGIGVDGPSGVAVVHNTVFDASIALTVNFGAAGVDLRNNLFVGSSEAGVWMTDGDFSNFDYNLFWDNAGNDCSGCTPGPNSLFEDPSFADLAGGDLSLQASSPAVDAGVELGYDRNGASSGLFDGLAPDLGAIESD